MSESLPRWRLVLGKYAQRQMPKCLNREQERMANALERLYGREYADRGVRQGRELSPGSLDPSQLNVPKWLGEIRELFPQETCEEITQHALERYGLIDLVKDPKTLASLTPSVELLSSVLALKGRMNKEVMQEVRTLVRRVVEDIQKRLKQLIQREITGKRNRFQNSPLKVARNFDAHKTIRRNLKHYDPERRRLILRRAYFFSRIRKQIPWEIILCVDQSGSMADSLIHSAVVAGALAELPSLKVRLVVFDTAIVDLTEHASDPVEVLMSVQLGGGTNIGAAMAYCRTLITDPKRTIVVLITDFCEGADPSVLRRVVRGMKGDGCHVLGLASLDESGGMWYDQQMAQRLASDGMRIAAVTPGRLAEWLAQIMNGAS